MLYCDCWLVCLPGLPVGGLRARTGLTHHYIPSPWHRPPHRTKPRTSSERICDNPALLVRGVFGGKQAALRLPVAHWTPSLSCKLGSFPGQWGCSAGLRGGRWGRDSGFRPSSRALTEVCAGLGVGSRHSLARRRQGMETILERFQLNMCRVGAPRSCGEGAWQAPGPSFWAPVPQGQISRASRVSCTT